MAQWLAAQAYHPQVLGSSPGVYHLVKMLFAWSREANVNLCQPAECGLQPRIITHRCQVRVQVATILSKMLFAWFREANVNLYQPAEWRSG